MLTRRTLLSALSALLAAPLVKLVGNRYWQIDKSKAVPPVRNLVCAYEEPAKSGISASLNAYEERSRKELIAKYVESRWPVPQEEA